MASRQPEMLPSTTATPGLNTPITSQSSRDGGTSRGAIRSDLLQVVGKTVGFGATVEVDTVRLTIAEPRRSPSIFVSSEFPEATAREGFR